MKKNIVIATALVLALTTSQIAFAADTTGSASPPWEAPKEGAAATAAPAKATPAPAKATPAPAKATAAPAKATAAPAKATAAPAKATPAPAKATPAPVAKPAAPAPAAKPAAPAKADVVAGPSVKESSDPAKIAAGLSDKGTWIFSILGNVTLTEDLDVKGTFYDKGDKEVAKGKVYRKLALYAQDANHKVTANYTLTVPRLNVTSPNFRIQNGTVKGDIYVNATGFQLTNTKVEGNVYFATQSAKDSADIATGKVSGEVKVKAFVDGLASASPQEGIIPEGVHQMLSKQGSWIYSITNNVKLADPLVVSGTFYNDNDPKTKVYRKLALYAQDAAHVVTANYTLTVPSIVVESPNFRIQNGTVKGDIYVNATGFELRGTTVTGNVYFAKQAQMDSANLTAGTVSGKTELKPLADGVSTASVKEGVAPADVAKGLSKDGTWIYSITNNVTLEDELVVDGLFYDKDVKTGAVYRKLALYAQDAKRVVTANYKLTVPKMTVNSPNFNIVNGSVVGDIYVNANGFVLNKTVVEGNIYFAKDSQMETANLTAGVVSGGSVEVKALVDGVATASVKEGKTAEEIAAGLSSAGTWIYSVTNNVTVPAITVAGTFYNKDVVASGMYRKLALASYGYDAEGKSTIANRYTLTTPKMVVTSPNFRIQYGTLKGDVYVDAAGFNLADATLNGNLIFRTWEQRNAFVLGTGKVTGTISVSSMFN